jgi:hypothetical protein
MQTPPKTATHQQSKREEHRQNPSGLAYHVLKRTEHFAHFTHIGFPATKSDAISIMGVFQEIIF